MATFYKYKEREDIGKSMIDWSGLTKEISDNLIKEKNRRDNLKLELEQDQLEKLKALDEYTKGLDATMNQAMLEVAQNYKDYLLLSHRNMKNGLISVNDTKIRKQGAMDTFNAINDVTKTYNEKMSAFMEKGGNINEFIAANTARVLDISKSQLVIDDMGRGTFVTTDENGNEVVMPATSFNTILNDTYERFDTAGEVEKAVSNVGQWIESPSGYTTIEDLRRNPEYNKWKENKIKAILSDDKTTISAAADMLNMKPTTDKKLVESDPDNYFYAEYKNGKIIFDSKSVKDKVSKALDSEIEIAIDKKITKTPYRPSPAETSARIAKKQKEQTFRLISDALKGDKTALQALVSDPSLNISSLTKSEDGKGYNITTPNGTIFIDTEGNIKESGSTFVSALFGSDDAEEYKNFEKSTEMVSPVFEENVSDVKYIKSAPIVLTTKENIDALQEAGSGKVVRQKGMSKVEENKTIDEKINDVTKTVQSIIAGKASAKSIGSAIEITKQDGTTGYVNIYDIIENPNDGLMKIQEIVNQSSTKESNLNASKRK